MVPWYPLITAVWVPDPDPSCLDARFQLTKTATFGGVENTCPQLLACWSPVGIVVAVVLGPVKKSGLATADAKIYKSFMAQSHPFLLGIVVVLQVVPWYGWDTHVELLGSPTSVNRNQ